MLGTYKLEEDAARARDKVARILGRSGLNFPNSDALEIHGPRSAGADRTVAAAVEDARAFMAANGKVGQTSTYIGVSKDQRNKTHPWRAEIMVSPGIGSVRTYTCAHKPTHARHIDQQEEEMQSWELRG